MREMPFQKHKNFKNREGATACPRPAPDPQRNARLQAKINFQFQVNADFFLLLANTLHIAKNMAQFRLNTNLKSSCSLIDFTKQ